MTAVVVAPEVQGALAAGRPVVALESAIVTHGLPRPTNLEVARDLEQRLRDAGVVPATVAVLDGRPTVGLSSRELERLATDPAPAKASVRDLPVLAAGVAVASTAGTTVAATAWLAHRVGIAVFATGGIGGVHRGAAQSFDESADLAVLAHTPIAVVCAGVKSILDVPATLERLETLGVTVLGYRTDRFPGFYVTDSSWPVPARVDSPEEAVAVMRAAAALGAPGAVLVANPVPEADQLDRASHDAAVAEALRAAAAGEITGPALTPFLLDQLERMTGGASLSANLAAVRDNVRVAAAVAAAYAPFPAS